MGTECSLDSYVSVSVFLKTEYFYCSGRKARAPYPNNAVSQVARKGTVRGRPSPLGRRNLRALAFRKSCRSEALSWLRSLRRVTFPMAQARGSLGAGLLPAPCQSQ